MSRLLTPLHTFRQFHRDVQLLLLATAILAISFFGIQALLKILYILRLGYGPEYVGLFNASGALGYMTMSLPSGWLGERWGNSRTMVLGALVTVVGMAMLPLTETLPLWARDAWPIASQILGAGGYALFSINFVPALMALTTPETRTSAYAMSSTLRSLGTLVGTTSGGLLPGLLAGFLGVGLDAASPYRLGLWVGPVIALLAVLPLLRTREAGIVQNVEEAKTGGSFPMAPVGLIILFVILGQAANASCQSFCSAYMDAELGLSPATIGLIAGAGQFAAIFAPMFLPRLTRRRGNGWALLVITLGSATSLLPLILLRTGAGAALGRFGTLALGAMWMPMLQVYQMETIPARWRSLAYGAVSTAMGMSFALMSYTGGYVASAWGYTALFSLGFTLSISAAALMHFLVRHPNLMAVDAPQPAPSTGD